MARKRIYLIAATFQAKLMIRFVVCSRLCQIEDIDFAWNEIRGQANEVFSSIYKNSIEFTNKEIKYSDKNLVNIAASIQKMKIDNEKKLQKIS